MGKLPPKEREWVIDTEVSKFKEFLDSDGDAILSSATSTDEEIFLVLNAIPWFTREHIRGTRFDMEAAEWPSVALSSAMPEKTLLAKTLRERTPGEFTTGNGVLVRKSDGSTEILTNAHVILAILSRAGIHLPEMEKMNRERGLDIAFVTPSKNVSQESMRAFDFDEMASTEDVHGSLVEIAGIRTGGGSAADDSRLYASSAVRVTQRMQTFLEEHGAGDINVGDFMYHADPGDSRLRKVETKTATETVIDAVQGKKIREGTNLHGTSGSPVLMENAEGKNVLAGVNVLVLWQFDFKNIPFDFGAFQGSDSIKVASTMPESHVAIDDVITSATSSSGEYFGDASYDAVVEDGSFYDESLPDDSKGSPSNPTK
jgi:hypothetical protein